MNPGPPALDASTLPLVYRGGGKVLVYEIVSLRPSVPVYEIVSLVLSVPV